MTETTAVLPPLHTQNPLDRFSNRAQDYAKCRPSYPAAAIDHILSDLGHPATLTIADIGAGTGISSRLLADRRAKVWAIEPNEAMRAAATPHPLVEMRAGTAEQTGLADQSVDVITCCQAFHWFEPIATLREFHRILKPTGRVVLAWNTRNLQDEFTQQFTDVLRKASDKAFFDRPDRKSSKSLEESALFKNFSTYVYPYYYHLTFENLVGLVMSASYVPKETAIQERLIVDLRSLYERWEHNGKITITYNTNLYLADPV